MSVGAVLLDILVVLIAAKLAAELAERVGLPAVVGEILAGVLIGPSVLGLVGGGDEVLRVLGEIGVILLLLEVGLQMDLEELGAVGRASMLVAIVGVAAPFVLGYGAAELTGHGGNTAVFVGAALTATSVGITARVFGDLRVLTGAEARTVLGAAVIDDVMGLVILTVVVRIVTEGSVSVGLVAGVIAAAVAFLVVAGFVGVRVAPPLFRLLSRVSRSPGTLVATALAFALAFAELATVAQLAPIVGAFLAGLALARSDQSERIRRELTPVGHLFVPVFFLQIGIDAEVGEFIRPEVLMLAAALLAAAVVGKLVSPLGAIGSPGDKLLIGLGMLPRGEVGLIFAGLGLQQGILGEDIYAALLLVVLATTLVSPSLLRWRLQRIREARRRAPVERSPEPEGGWLQIHDDKGPSGPSERGQLVDLVGRPGDHLAPGLALEAALLVARARPGPRLLDWLAEVSASAAEREGGGSPALRWDAHATRLLFRVLAEGNVRSWRFLEASGLLDAALPELADAVRRRRADPFELDPVNLLRWSLVERLRELSEPGGASAAGSGDWASAAGSGDWASAAGSGDSRAAREWALLEHPEWLLLAALILETAGEGESPVVAARRLVKRLDLGAAAEQEIALLVGHAGLLRAAAIRPKALTEEAVLPIALHLDKAERARALYLLSLALGDLDLGERRRLDELYDLVQGALASKELTGREARNLVERRRAEAARLVGEAGAGTGGTSKAAAAARRIAEAPRGYLLAQGPVDIARQAMLVDPLPPRGRVRVAVTPVGGDANQQGPVSEQGQWRVEVVCRDRRGLLAVVTGVLARAGLDVVDAALATWPAGAALESFRVAAAASPSAEELESEIEAALGASLSAPPVPDASVEFDGHASPWYTLCEVRATDRPAMLHALAVAFTAAAADVHTASVSTVDGCAVDRFELTDGRSEKLGEGAEAAIRSAIVDGVTFRRGRPWARAALRSG